MFITHSSQTSFVETICNIGYQSSKQCLYCGFHPIVSYRLKVGERGGQRTRTYVLGIGQSILTSVAQPCQFHWRKLCHVWLGLGAGDNDKENDNGSEERHISMVSWVSLIWRFFPSSQFARNFLFTHLSCSKLCKGQRSLTHILTHVLYSVGWVGLVRGLFIYYAT